MHHSGGELQIERMRHERVPILDTTRVLLCDFAAGDLDRPLHRVDADWEEVFQGICRNGLLGLTHRYLERHTGHDYPPPAFRERIRQAYHLDAMRMALKRRHVGRVLSHLAGASLDYMVLKGPAVAQTVYPHPSLRSFNDLDLMVRECDWASTHRLLTELGCRSDHGAQHPPKLCPQAVVHHSQYWQPEMGLLVEVHYDDLLHSGFAARDVEAFWRRAVWIDIDGASVKTLSLEDELIHLCVHAHQHKYSRLLTLSDIAFMVRDHAAQLDWDCLLATVRIEDACIEIYYSLWFLERMLGVGVPEGVLSLLRPNAFRRWWHHRLLPQDNVLSLQPIVQDALSSYLCPFLMRLISELLVMGRRRESIHHLFHLLAPPRAWLMEHYDLDASEVWFHALLRPFRFFYHAIADGLDVIIELARTSLCHPGRILRR
jgi:hypothetical protein